jgi:hypothetical protein
MKPMRDGEANDKTYNSTEGGDTVVAAVAVRFYQFIVILKHCTCISYENTENCC